MFAVKPVITLYLVGFALALVASLVLTYVVRARARRAGLFDPTDDRKVHTQPIPRIGGVGIVLAIAVALSVVMMLGGARIFGDSTRGLVVVLMGGLAIHLLGLRDDIRPLRARWKFLAQIAIALAVYAAGLRVETLTLPGVGILDLGTTAGLLFTVLWLVGITNAFNLIDGLDGLASGAAMFALTTMFVVASINGQVGAALVTIVLAGATLGFLVYNFHPASIFLGDSGSLFLGFMLAGVGLLSSQKGSTAVAVAIPVVSLGLPVLDTLLAIMRRFLRGQPIFSADRGHIHHRLLNLGHSPRQVALLLYGACAFLALGGMMLVNESGFVALVLVVVGLGVGLAVQRLRFHEFEELARLVRKGVQQREVIGRRVRIREASNRIARSTDLDMVFGTLARAFADDEFQRAEVRLRRSFVERTGAALLPLDRRADPDVPIWSWSRHDAGDPCWWEIKLPLLTPSAERIGSLVLWQDGASSETSLSHMHTIARELSREIERKLSLLWPTALVAESLLSANAASEDADEEALEHAGAGAPTAGRARALGPRAPRTSAA